MVGFAVNFASVETMYVRSPNVQTVLVGFMWGYASIAIQHIVLVADSQNPRLELLEVGIFALVAYSFWKKMKKDVG